MNKKLKNKKPYFSIITVVLNGEKYLSRAIKSVANQNFKNFEHIIIDGGSNDKTIKIIKRNKRSISFWSSGKDKNMWDAINKGIKVSKGKVIGILNSDDYYSKNGLSICYKYFKKYQNIDFIFGAVKKNKIYHSFRPERINYKFNIYPSHSAGFFIKKKIHDKIGYYNTKYDFCSDYDFFYRLIKIYKIKGTSTKRSEVVGYFQKGGISEKISVIEKKYIESKIRFKNGQNIIVVGILFVLHVLYSFKNFF